MLRNILPSLVTDPERVIAADTLKNINGITAVKMRFRKRVPNGLSHAAACGK